MALRSSTSSGHSCGWTERPVKETGAWATHQGGALKGLSSQQPREMLGALASRAWLESTQPPDGIRSPCTPYPKHAAWAGQGTTFPEPGLESLLFGSLCLSFSLMSWVCWESFRVHFKAPGRRADISGLWAHASPRVHSPRYRRNEEVTRYRRSEEVTGCRRNKEVTKV